MLTQNEFIEYLGKISRATSKKGHVSSQSGIIIDAYKYSRPVIAFAVGAIPEEIDDGRSGYLVEAGNNEKFAEKLKEAIKLSTDEYGVMSKHSYQYGCKKYATRGAVERFVRLLEER